MGDRMSKQQQPKPQPPPKALEPAPAWDPPDVGVNDFFRSRRKGNGWIVEMVRLKGESVVFRRDVWEWDGIDSTERRLADLAFRAERAR